LWNLNCSAGAQVRWINKRISKNKSRASGKKFARGKGFGDKAGKGGRLVVGWERGWMAPCPPGDI
jgi:hypothetical protein